MKAKAFDLQKTYRGEWVLMVTLTEDSVREAMNLVDHAKNKVYEILAKVFKPKRSLPANAYFHVLVNKLAAVLGVDDDEMKTHLVLKYGTIAEIDNVPFTITVPKEANVEDYYRYARWYECDNCTDTYILYKQTHTMNGAEFARLIDGTVEDCKELGIETLTPAELALMYAQADKVHRNTKKR